MSNVFSALTLGDITIKNRLIRSATWEGMAEAENGLVTDALVDLYQRLAEGGVGLIITGYAYLGPNGRGLPRQLGIFDDKHIPGLARLAKVIHQTDTKAIVQLVHAGGQTNARTTGVDDIVAPSAVYYATHKVTPRELAKKEIEEIVEAHGQATARAMEAGFDGVQIHAAHGYLGNRFLSPAFNKRTDEYGGSVTNRARFLLDALAACKQSLRTGAILSVKLNSEDFEEQGLTYDDALEVAQLIEAGGANHLEVSGGTPLSGAQGAVRQGIDAPEKEAYFRQNARGIKQSLSMPVGVVGGVRSLAVAEEIISSGDCDTVSMARPFICEPDLPKKWREGTSTVAKCTSDSKCFAVAMKKGIRCAVFSS